MAKRQWLLVILLITVWFGASRYNARVSQMSGSGFSAPNLTEPALPRKMATGWTLLDSNGKLFDWSSTKDRLILVNIWATWCPPCRAELPSLANLANDKSLSDEVVVLCVSTDDRPEALKSYLQKNNLTFPAYFAPELPFDFVTEGIPATFLINSQGELLGSEVGAARWDAPEFIQQLKNRKSK
ncbi:MAG: TlpA disulfide reductase family protein [Planctomycetota bacterium]